MVEVRSIAPLGAAPPVGGDHARVDPASPVPLPTAAPRIPVRRRRRGRWTRARLRRSRDRRLDAPPLTASRLPDPVASGSEHVDRVLMENLSFVTYPGLL